MSDRSNRNLSPDCKDLDGILPIRKQAWKLQEPLPSTSGNQLPTNFEASFSPPNGPGSQQRTEGYPPQFQNSTPILPVQNQPESNFSPIYGISSPGQSQHTHTGYVQHEGYFPVMGPIFWYYPCCHQCQHFANQYFH